jgi:ABC-type lipoprotein release transport system permease subunit
MRPGEAATIGSMAFRNLSRHKVKTIITTIAVAISVALYIAMDGWILGMNLDSRRNIVSCETGAAKVQSAAYFDKKDQLPMYEAFRDWEAYARALEEGGYAAAPRFVFSGTLYSRSGSAPMVFNGVDPELEGKVLRYADYLEAGRFPRPDSMEIAVGTLAAEKLRIGIPARIGREEFGRDLLSAARNDEEKAFIRSLYSDPPQEAEDRRLRLADPLPAEESARLWDILTSSGRMDVRLSTVVDLKAAPEIIRGGRFEEDLLPLLSGAGRERVLAAYEKDPFLGDYVLSAESGEAAEAALAAMLAADYAGAVRHVNQLMALRVTGVVNSPNPKTNGNVAYIPLGALQGDTGLMLEGEVTELLVRAAGADDAALPGPSESPEQIRAALGSALPEGIGVYGWEQYVEDYLAAAAGDNVSTRIMIGLLFLLSFIGIANTMLMAILERTKEIGMLRALGMTNGQLTAAYTFEAGLVGLIGSLIGIGLGCLINIPMVSHGIDYSAVVQEMNGDYGYRIVALFRSAWNPPVIAGTGIVAILVSAVMALPPILRTLRKPVTESLRFE